MSSLGKYLSNTVKIFFFGEMNIALEMRTGCGWTDLEPLDQVGSTMGEALGDVGDVVASVAPPSHELSGSKNPEVAR